MNPILERIEREAGLPGLTAILAERLSATDLQSLMLEVYRQRSRRLQPAAVLSAYEANRFVHPSAVSPLRLLAWEQVAFARLPLGFEAIELSPLCPLGTSAVAAGLDQNWAVATARGSEVVSDSTNVLALECALRRRALLRSDPKSSDVVELAASHRLLRAQNYQNPLALAHFAAFALCSAGRSRGGFEFELDALRLHIGFYLDALRAFLGSEVQLEVSLTDFSQTVPTAALEIELVDPLQTEFETIRCFFDRQRTSGRGYYPNLCFHIHATLASGQRLELADGGSVDWTQKYLSSARERLLISGIGSERLIAAFGKET